MERKTLNLKRLIKILKKKFQILKGQALHAKSLGFFHLRKKNG